MHFCLLQYQGSPVSAPTLTAGSGSQMATASSNPRPDATADSPVVSAITVELPSRPVMTAAATPVISANLTTIPTSGGLPVPPSEGGVDVGQQGSLIPVIAGSVAAAVGVIVIAFVIVLAVILKRRRQSLKMNKDPNIITGSPLENPVYEGRLKQFCTETMFAITDI